MLKVKGAAVGRWLNRHKTESALVFIFIALNSVLILTNGLILRVPTRVLLRYGDSIPRLVGKRLTDAEPSEVSGKRANLVLYLSPRQLKSRSVGTLKYGGLLAHRYAEQGLDVTAIVQEDDPEFRQSADMSRPNYRVLLDPGGELGGRLGLNEGESGTFLFDISGMCRFSTRANLVIEDLRQLVSWEMAGADPLNGRRAGHQVVEEGQPLGSWMVTDVRTSRRQPIGEIRAGRPGLFILVTSDCSVCSLNEYLSNFAALERSAKTGADGTTWGDAALVFDFNFSRADILQAVARFKISAACYISEEELPAVTLKGDLLASDDRQVAAIQTDNRRNVLRVIPLSTSDTADAAPTLRYSTPQPTTTQNFQSVPANLEEMFHDLALSVYDVASRGGKYYVSDVRGNRLLVINEAMQVEREIGRIGSGPGQLLHPGHVGVAKDGTIFVEDGGNERVQRFDPDGHCLGAFSPGAYEGFKVSREKEVYLGQPESGSLVNVFTAEGKKLRSFGKLKKFSEVYGAQYSDKDELYEVAVNRVRLFIDEAGSVYVTFMLAPIIQKYDSRGTLLFERRLQGEEINQLTDILINRSAFKYLSTSRDGFEARFITLDPVVDPGTGNIHVLLPNGLIYVADGDGQKVSLLRPQIRQAGVNPQLFSAAIGAKGEILFIPFLPKRCFRLLQPAAETAK